MEIAIRDKKKVDFFKKREEKEQILKEAMIRLEEHKRKTPESVYPSSIYGNSKIIYSCEYIQLLENVIKAKTSLEVMDLLVESLLRERISILEEIL